MIEINFQENIEDPNKITHLGPFPLHRSPRSEKKDLLSFAGLKVTSYILFMHDVNPPQNQGDMMALKVGTQNARRTNK